MPLTDSTPLWRKYLTVEPVVFFYFYGFLMVMPIGRLYIYERVSDMKGFPYRNFSQGAELESGCGGEGVGENSTLIELEKEVQTFVSQLDMSYNLVLTIPSLLLAPLWGPWTDKGGKRKPALMVAILGATLEVVIVLLVMYFNWSLYVLFVGAAIDGFSGFMTVFMIGATSYIADKSSEEERAFRLAILYSAIFLAGVVSQLTSGLWIHYVGFIPSTWFILACFVSAGLWAFFFVPEIPKPAHQGRTPRFFSRENAMGVINVFRKRREAAGRKNLAFLMICAGLVFLSSIGIEGVKTLFILKSPLCWLPQLIGFFYAFEMFVHGVGSVAGIKFLAYCFKDLTIARIGMVTSMSASILLAFCDRTWMVFLVAVVGVFNGVVDPIVVGGMSRIVGEDEQGALFSAYGMVSAVTQLIGAILFNMVYQATLGLAFKGFVFILCALLFLIPFGLLSFIDLPPIVKENEREEREILDSAQEQNCYVSSI